MVNIEKISEEAMKIITFSGMAKSSYMEALKAYKTKSIDEAEKMLVEGDRWAGEAHGVHSKILTEEMQTLTPQISLLLTHGEDQLMSAETIRILVTELKELYIR